MRHWRTSSGCAAPTRRGRWGSSFVPATSSRSLVPVRLYIAQRPISSMGSNGVPSHPGPTLPNRVLSDHHGDVMPRRPPHPCAHPGCAALVYARFCTPHARAVERARGSAPRRGYGRAWASVRTQVLQASPVCVQCGSPDDPHVDHIVPRAQGGTDALSNLQRLCATCHSRKTVAHDGGFGRASRRGTIIQTGRGVSISGDARRETAALLRLRAREMERVFVGPLGRGA